MPDELTNNKLYSNTKLAVVPGYYLVCYNRERKNLYNSTIIQVFSCSKIIVTIPQKT